MFDKFHIMFHSKKQIGIVLSDLIYVVVNLVAYLQENYINYDLDRLFDFIINKENLIDCDNITEYVELLLRDLGVDYYTSAEILEYVTEYLDKDCEVPSYDDYDHSEDVVVKNSDCNDLMLINYKAINFFNNQFWKHILFSVKNDIKRNDIKEHISVFVYNTTIYEIYKEDPLINKKEFEFWKMRFRNDIEQFLNCNDLYDIEFIQQESNGESCLKIDIYY